MVRTNQGGSVLGFVMIGGVLALLLIGGIYFIRQQLNAPTDRGVSPTPTETQTQPEEQKPGEQTPPEKEKEQEAKLEEQKPANEEKEKSSSSTLPGGGADKKTQELPQTGPAESLVSMLALALIAGVFTAYVRSHRAVRSL